MLPLLVHLLDQRELEKGEGPIGLVLAPTREIAIQIEEVGKSLLRRLSRPTPATTATARRAPHAITQTPNLCACGAPHAKPQTPNLCVWPAACQNPNPDPLGVWYLCFKVMSKLAAELPPPRVTCGVFVGGIPEVNDEKRLRR